MNTPQRLMMMREHTRTLADLVANSATMSDGARRTRAFAHVHDMLFVLVEEIEAVQKDLYGEKETT
jgi:hypothetical protein